MLSAARERSAHGRARWRRRAAFSASYRASVAVVTAGHAPMATSTRRRTARSAMTSRRANRGSSDANGNYAKYPSRRPCGGGQEGRGKSLERARIVEDGSRRRGRRRRACIHSGTRPSPHCVGRNTRGRRAIPRPLKCVTPTLPPREQRALSSPPPGYRKCRCQSRIRRQYGQGLLAPRQGRTCV